MSGYGVKDYSRPDRDSGLGHGGPPLGDILVGADGTEYRVHHSLGYLVPV